MFQSFLFFLFVIALVQCDGMRCECGFGLLDFYMIRAGLEVDWWIEIVFFLPIPSDRNEDIVFLE